MPFLLTIHNLNASQTEDISTRTISQREWFIARVSGKLLGEKVRKQFDIRALEVFFHSTGIKALCFFFFSQSVPPHQSFHKCLSLHYSYAKRFLMECCHVNTQPRPFKQEARCLREKRSELEMRWDCFEKVLK